MVHPLKKHLPFRELTPILLFVNKPEEERHLATGFGDWAFGLTCQRTCLAETHNNSGGRAHWVSLLQRIPRRLGCSSYEGTGQVTVLS